ncbi:MAG: response regulator [Candidatus Eremiobacteraeota bacterium]|nr:response regulator [Candidatus Eremiobacteraeota bacterium]
MILEDDPDMRAALAEVLADEGYQVVTAASGREAVDLAASAPFDLLVSDIRMEGMSGLEAIEAIKQHQPELGSMVVSGWASEAETLRAVELNVGAYLKKPFRSEEFLAAVQTTLQRRPRPVQDWLDWSLSLLGRLLDGQALVAPRGALENAMQLARQWAAALGYDGPGQATAARLALLRATEELPGFFLPDPAPLWLSGWSSQDEPLQWLGLASWKAAGEGGELPDSSALQPELGGDSEVWAAYDRARHSPTPPVQGDLLELGKVMLETGDLEAAQRAFESSLEAQPLRASHHLALLEWRRGNARAAVDWARQAHTLATRLGPLSAASVALECALLCCENGLAEGRLWLEELAQWSQRLGLRGHQAVCALALQASQWTQPALEVLADPHYWSESQLAARWLLPSLLQLPASPARDALLRLHSGALARQQTVAPGPSPESILRFTCLGPFDVQLGDRSLAEAAWKTQKNKLLLAYLLRRQGQSVHEEQVLEDFWPEDAVRGKRNLYSALSLIRRALGQADSVLRQQERLTFNWQLPHSCDHHLFEKSAQRGLELETSEDALFHLKRAAQVYHAPYLEGCFYDWALARREELEGVLVKVLSRLCQLECQRRHYGEALEFSNRFLQQAPHLQEAHLWKMRALLGSGQPEEVLRQFQRCQRMLHQEFGLEPSTELMEVMLRARHGFSEASEIG